MMPFTRNTGPAQPQKPYISRFLTSLMLLLRDVLRVDPVRDGLIVSFDLLNFSPDDAPSGRLILDAVTIEAFSSPASP